MDYRIIDWKNYPRKAHFEYFNAMADPYAGVTVPVDITRFFGACRAGESPFFLSFLWCAGRAANAVPQLRQRIWEGRPVEFAACDTSHTVLRGDGTYSYCRLSCMRPFEEFLPAARRAQEEAKAHGDLDDGEDALSLLFISTLPWVGYTGLRQPVPTPADSNPRVTWGKYATQGERTTMPVTLLVNHALVDGAHMGQFFAALEGEMERFAQERGRREG